MQNVKKGNPRRSLAGGINYPYIPPKTNDGIENVPSKALLAC